MGAVDLVVQIEAPPSVSAGLQRIGRPGTRSARSPVAWSSRNTRGDLVSCAVVSERMTAGAIEELRYLRNPLDVLAQQIVAMVAWTPGSSTSWPRWSAGGAVRRAARLRPARVLDMLSGRYPSTAFAELRPGWSGPGTDS
jgi:ATP-dependent Lhr-like helicase